ncbi:T9SS type A sorting domain-containing protein [Flavobacterium weaverense]|uniref:Putative secreted protein (Por secretion system target) n=1 Tax=Flavobacterium weaverense TaxID=271156 RepID=A0A3L9ZY83_9FLAO|nr:T9SS type A sorting domain-containing protein [Flavobacterium weaverense]RMA77683.1 putative secreted protein (Por secretion system target) [Flavobacterium weaverense]
MKDCTENKFLTKSYSVFMIGLILYLSSYKIHAQYVSSTNAYISVGTNTAVSLHTLNNDSASKVNNDGLIALYTVNNLGTIQGDGMYSISKDFVNSGTFSSEKGTIKMNGIAEQVMPESVTIYNNLVIDNAAGVILNSNQTNIKNLTINLGKILKVEASKTLTVKGSIINNGGTAGLVLKSTSAGTASLNHNSDNVPATMQRYISGNKEDWHFLSAPVSDQVLAGTTWLPTGTYGNGTGYDLYIWNEPTPCWTYILNNTVAPTWTSIHASLSFVKGRGYLYSTQALNPTKEFIGLLNNGNVSYPITNTATSLDPTVRGFNLVGNPYPSSMDWKSTLGWSRSNLVESGGGYDMWIWNPASNNYGVYNSLSSAGTNGVTQYIAPTQGYFVRAATSGNIGTSNAVRNNNGANSWMRLKKTISENLIVRFSSNETYGYDEVLLQFGYPKNEPGAFKLFSRNDEAPSAYFTDLNNDLSVRYLTSTAENKSVPINFKAGKDGNYSLSIGVDSADFEILFLEDKKTKKIIDLKANPKHEFKATLKDVEDRFIIHFAPVEQGTEDLEAKIYYKDKKVCIDLTLIEGVTDVKIFDLLGKLLINKKVDGSSIHQFDVNLKYAVYIVKVTNKKKIVTMKVLVD